MALPASDSFTEASNTPLASHTDAGGGGYSWAGANIANFAVIAADGELSCDGNASVALVASPANADYYVEISGKTGGATANDRAGVWARYIDGSAGYRLAIYGNDTWDFTTWAGTILANGTITGSVGSFSASTYYTLRVTVAGTTITAHIGATQVASVTNSAHSAAGNPGVFLRGVGRITSLSAAHPGASNPPSITDVDSDESITSTQAGWVITGTDFDTATVEIRQGSEIVAQTINSQDSTTIDCDTVFDDGAGPHLKYGSATLAVVNGDDQEDTIAITIAVPSGRAYVDIDTPNGTAANRITAVNDIASGDQLEISNVIGGTIADVTVYDDGTFDCAEAVDSFDVRVWDAGDSTWGNIGTQAVGDAVPDQFSFTDQSGVALSSTITSAPVTITGIEVDAPISVSGGTYDINGSGSFTADPGTVSNGDTVRARHTSSASYSTATNTTVTIGGVSDTFTSTTRAEPAAGGGGINAQPRLGGMMIFG